MEPMRPEKINDLLKYPKICKEMKFKARLLIDEKLALAQVTARNCAYSPMGIQDLCASLCDPGL
jgi:hypothetical protein